MIANNKGRRCQYPICGYNSEFNSACAIVRGAYGKCAGPCDGPCHIVSCLHYPPGMLKRKIHTADS